MDAMDVLGALLGRKGSSNRGGGSADILKEMMGGRKSAPAPPRQRTHPRAQQPSTIEGAARSLEEMLGVGRESTRSVPSPPMPSRPRQAPPVTEARLPERTPEPRVPERSGMDAQSEMLVRAMISAAKSDGSIDQAEQEHVVKQFGQLSQDEVNFLKQEFARPVDVRELAWSVPIGLEEHVYTVSLLAIDLDENKEAQYLGELAHGLRLSPQKCNEIHRQYRAPEIFGSAEESVG
ncbi:hypothetical protein Q31b_44190 [Novipirellula aureliae]|uniref:Inner membrane protein YebE n=1 Tax=Novipirellula aureliae TaxID=2527966 RepID=A0A5C6DPQ7_9BACT|nr:DUF533 domain-containing protein [Novipirellula aureliae]TWU37631.1 hypothetical protein Q31b_44190 [Novipirellula aureliae]